MKNLFVIFFLLVLCISCGNEEPENQEGKGNFSGYSYRTAENIKIATEEPKINWSDFEDEVFACMDSVRNSAAENRRERIEKYVSYASKVDGAVSEGYSNFAFEYVDSHYVDFFSVLTVMDTSLIDIWANSAAGEIMIIAENQEKDFMKNYEKRFKGKILKMNTKEQKLARLYISKLTKYSTIE